MTHWAWSVAHHLLTVDLSLIVGAWIASGIGAAFHYVWQHKAAEKSFRAFLRFMLPSEIFRHPSCRRDYLYAVISHFTEPFTVGSVLFAVPVATVSVFGACQHLFGHYEPLPPDGMLAVATLLVVLLVQDFTTWFSHWVEHKSRIMWEVHKVHHSAEFLNPISNRRHHPWQSLWENGLNNAGVGLVLGVAAYAFRVPVTTNALLGVDAFFVANMLSFYHLRHSHIPLHYGRFEKYFLSPAQHQLHHSQEAVDWDRNFGLLTSIWDRVFGTIRYTIPEYRYRVGLQAELVKEYDSVWKFFTTPVVNIGKLLWAPAPSRAGAKAPASASTQGLGIYDSGNYGARTGGASGSGDALLGGAD